MGADAIKEGIVQMCGRIHQSVEAASLRYLEEQVERALSPALLTASGFGVGAGDALQLLPSLA